MPIRGGFGTLTDILPAKAEILNFALIAATVAKGGMPD
jgi:hypothetical protein